MLLADTEEPRHAACRRVIALNGAAFTGDSRLAGLPGNQVSGFLNRVGTSTGCEKAQVEPVNCPGGQAGGAYIEQEGVCMRVEGNPVESKVRGTDGFKVAGSCG